MKRLHASRSAPFRHFLSIFTSQFVPICFFFPAYCFLFSTLLYSLQWLFYSMALPATSAVPFRVLAPSLLSLGLYREPIQNAERQSRGERMTRPWRVSARQY